ncbi:MAG: type II toxin-antitoxin system HicB family antitoxin [Defluviitaleaceae bacterium]|nr:type II toxin-antitoxin system HicB family antitoxin [Defluviitaleaceae bacterium]
MLAKLAAVCTKQDNGSYFAYCPDIQACFAQGDTYEDAIYCLRELAEDLIVHDLDDEDREYLVRPKERVFVEFEVNVTKKI